MINIADAEIYVTTRFSQESGSNDRNWFRLGDYSCLAEFFIDCASWFSDEEDPEYLYPEWDGIPYGLIREDWICPHIFEVRNILMELGDDEAASFLAWCKSFGWDIASEDPRKVLHEYEYSNKGLSLPEDIPDIDLDMERETATCAEEYNCDHDYSDDDYLLFEHSPGSFELFDDNYN